MSVASHPWQIQVQGWASDLEHLARHFTSPPVVVTKDPRGDGFLYESEAFGSCATS